MIQTAQSSPRRNQSGNASIVRRPLLVANITNDIYYFTPEHAHSHAQDAQRLSIAKTCFKDTYQAMDLLVQTVWRQAVAFGPVRHATNAGVVRRHAMARLLVGGVSEEESIVSMDRFRRRMKNLMRSLLLCKHRPCLVEPRSELKVRLLMSTIDRLEVRVRRYL